MACPAARHPLRVLYANPFPDLGGAEHSLLSLLRTLPSTVSPVVVTSAPGALRDEAVRLGVETHCVRFPSAGQPDPFRRAVRTLRALIRGTGAEVVHANSTRGALFGGLAGRAEEVPVLWHIREQLGAGPRTLLLRRLSQRWIGNSRAALLDSGVPVEHPASRIVHNGIPLDFIRDQPRSDRRSSDEDRVTVGMLGRVEPAKGQREFLQAAMLLMREAAGPVRARSRFLVAGGVLGPPPGRKLRQAESYARSLERFVDRHRLGLRVQFLGPITDPLPFYDGLDFLVVPSWREGFCRVVIEGMARGVPVIASRVGGIPEIITSGDNGWLVPPRDPIALARALGFLIRNPTLSSFLAERGRQRVREHFLEERSTRGIVDIYEEVSGRPLDLVKVEPIREPKPVVVTCT